MTVRDQDPHTYVGRGYAYLLKALARSLPCPTCHRRADFGLELYFAEVAFNTAEMLAEGINPWTPLGPGEQSWSTAAGRAAMRAKRDASA